MAKTYRILITDGSGVDIKPITVVQGVAVKSTQLRLLAKNGARFELQDEAKVKNLAPDQVRLKRVGKDLAIYFDNSQQADVLIEDFYAKNKDKSSTPPKLVGLAGDANMYEYVPQDPSLSSNLSELHDGNIPVIMSLGGIPLAQGFELSNLSIISASSGISAWTIAGGVVATAAAAGGGGGGSGSVAEISSAKATGALAVESDTGSSTSDGITNNNTPYYVGKADANKIVSITLDGHTYLGTTGTDGIYKIQITNPLTDGTYTPLIKVTDLSTGFSTTSDGSSFTVAASASSDANQSATVHISSISFDNGIVGDFITSDNSLSYSGSVSSFTSNGAHVWIQLKDSSDAVVTQQYIAFDSGTGAWNWDDTATTRADGKYTLIASMVDAAGNVIAGAAAATQAIYISANSLLPVNDTGTALEAGGASNTTLGSAATGNVLNNDVTLDPVVTMQAVPISMKAGLYGTLNLYSDGSYTYSVNNQNSTVNALRGASGIQLADTLIDSFQYTVTDLTGQARTATLAITIQGSNDVPTFSGISSEMVLPTATDAYSPVGLTVTDIDGYGVQSKFSVPSVSQGQYGTFIFNETNQTWTYQVDTIKASFIVNNSTAEFHDMITVTSLDGSGYRTLDVTVDGGGSGSPKVMNLINTTGVKAAGYLGLGDQLVLLGSNVTFDLTAATTSVSHVEKIDITGSGNNTIKLDINSLTQADLDGSIHKLFIDGNANDVVSIVHASLVADTATLVGYNRYIFDATHELLINKAIQTIVFSA